MIKKILFLGVILCTVALASDKDYYAMFMNGHKSGYMIESRQEEDNLITTTNEMLMVMTRFGTTLSVTTTMTSKEKTDGTAIGIDYSLEMTGTKVPKTFEIKDGQVKITTEMGIYKKDWDKNCIFPDALKRKLKAIDIKPGVEITSVIFDPESVDEIDSITKVLEKETVDILGKELELFKCQTTQKYRSNGLSISSNEWIDDDGNMYKSTTSVMGLSLDFLKCSKKYALSKNDSQEILISTLLPCPAPLDVNDFDKPIRYIVKRKTEALAIPTGSLQTVEDAGDDTVITVYPTIKPDDTKIAFEDAKKYLEASEYVDFNSPAISELAKQFQTKEANQRKAHRIEGFVSKYIESKDFTNAFSRASEVVKSKSGDCTEHAVLTAALCRSAGIPCKVVAGLVHTKRFFGSNQFGFHAWNEAYIDGHWIGLDSAIGKNGYDSSHIKLAEGVGRPLDFFAVVDEIAITKCEILGGEDE